MMWRVWCAFFLFRKFLEAHLAGKKAMPHYKTLGIQRVTCRVLSQKVAPRTCFIHCNATVSILCMQQNTIANFTLNIFSIHILMLNNIGTSLAIFFTFCFSIVILPIVVWGINNHIISQVTRVQICVLLISCDGINCFID